VLSAPLSPAERARRDALATASLAAATEHRAQLLALATRLMEDAAEGMDLYQQVMLDCHDALQHAGAEVRSHKAYLLTALRRAAKKRRRLARRSVPLPAHLEELPAAAPARADGIDCLAEAIHAELSATYPEATVNAFRLHVAGYSYREIEQLMGPGHSFSWLSRKLSAVKDHLRTTFAEAWHNLSE
jgi:DNA-directed RNA polymerase specialized sigma24 family protein